MDSYLSRWRDGLRLAPSRVLCLWLAFAFAPAQAQAPLSLDQAVARAEARSLLVAAAASQAQAARETAAAAGQRPDPVLTLGLGNLPIDGPERFSLNRDFMTMRSVGVMQELTGAARRDARTRRAQREVDAAELARLAALAALRRDTAMAWFDRSFQASMLALLQAQIAQAETQAEAAQTLYRSGQGSQAEVFAARGDVERLRDGLAQAELQFAVAATQLGRWLGDDGQQPLAARPALALPPWADGDLAGPLSRHPQVAAAAQQQAVADADVAIARAARSPDWSVELMLSQRGPAYSNMVSIGVSVPLQWDRPNRQDRDLAARLAGVDDVLARREEAWRAGEAEVRALLQTWHSLGDRLLRYDTALLSLAARRSEAALAAYRAGSGPLNAVLDARRAELDLRLQQLRLDNERARVWAQLNYLLLSPVGDAAVPEAQP